MGFRSSPLPPISPSCIGVMGLWYCNWFQLQWDERSADLPIMVKELLPIVLAGSVWGPTWGGHRVVCLCDNHAVVACLRSRTSRENHIMHMLRTLAFVEAKHSFALAPQYIDTKANHLADDLSRDNLPSFLSKVPDANPAATPLPGLLLTLLLDLTIDWLSPHWH